MDTKKEGLDVTWQSSEHIDDVLYVCKQPKKVYEPLLFGESID